MSGEREKMSKTLNQSLKNQQQFYNIKITKLTSHAVTDEDSERS